MDNQELDEKKLMGRESFLFKCNKCGRKLLLNYNTKLSANDNNITMYHTILNIYKIECKCGNRVIIE
jgi:DNA-directed RNA polymerase subunit RPC12/RpoP